jgi:hypothetical protein
MTRSISSSFYQYIKYQYKNQSNKILKRIEKMSKSSLTSSWSSSLASWSEQQQQQEENSYSNMMSRRPITGTRQNDNQQRNNSSHIHKIVSHNPKTTTTFKAQYFPNHQSILSTTGSASQYSRKVFVGGLPPDIDESMISSFLISHLYK